MPKINFTIPLSGFGTFFTTIVMSFPPYLSNIFLIPITIKLMETIHNHATGVKTMIKNIPIPIPKIQPASTFFNFRSPHFLNISFPPYYILLNFIKLCEQKGLICCRLCDIVIDNIKKEVKHGKINCKKSNS